MSAEVERLVMLLRSLPSVGLRVSYLRAYVADGSAEPARCLDALCDVTRPEREKDSAFAVAFLLSGLAAEPVVDRLGQHAAAERLENLGRLLRRGTPPAHEPVPAKVPLYAGRELSIGERRALARRPDRRLFDKLLADPDPLVLERLLENPRLTEDDVVRLVARRPATPAAQHAVARTAWLVRRRVRLALMQNPGTPPGVAVPLLLLCSKPELRSIASGHESAEIVRIVAREVYELRRG